MVDIPRIKNAADLPAHLAAVLAAWPTPGEYLLAVSGGGDSLAMMFLFTALGDAVPAPWRVLHVDHGLHPEAGRWAAHVAALCRENNIPSTIRPVRVQAGKAGREAAARQARYAALAAAMQPGTMLLTAHHLDDQAETVLLRLLRGAGVRGLGAIAPLRPFGPGQLGRPLLAVPRRLLRAYLKRCGVGWIEDSANLDLEHDRNYLRHRVLPVLARRWPAAASKMAASAEQLRAAEALLIGLDRAGLAAAEQNDRLDLAALAGLPALQRRRVVRLWLEQGNRVPPPARRLEVFLEQALHAAADRQPVLAWPAGRLYRYRGGLSFVPAGEWTTAAWEGGAQRWDDPATPFRHPKIGALSLSGPPPAAWPPLWVDRRRGGEQITVRVRHLHAGAAGGNVEDSHPPATSRTVTTPVKDRHHQEVEGRQHHCLKKWFQAAGEPPWRRAHWPLLYHDAGAAGFQLWAVGDRLLAPECRDWLAAAGLELHWRPPWILTPTTPLPPDPNDD